MKYLMIIVCLTLAGCSAALAQAPTTPVMPDSTRPQTAATRALADTGPAQDTTGSATAAAAQQQASPAPLMKSAPPRISLGLWEGQRNIGIVTSMYSITTMEGGGYLNWETGKNLDVRVQVSYLKGGMSSNSSDRYSTRIDTLILTGFPVQLSFLPVIRIGERLLVRAGGGLTYYKLKVRDFYSYSTTYYYSSSYSYIDAYGMSGFGGQFLLAVECELSPLVGLEAQYERGTAKLSYDYVSSDPDKTTYKDAFGATTESFRIGLQFTF